MMPVMYFLLRKAFLDILRSKTFHALSHGSGTQFIGVKIGDVTGDAMPNSQEISDTASGRQALIFGTILIRC